MKRRDFVKLGGLAIAGLSMGSAFGAINTPIKRALNDALKSGAGDPNNFVVILELDGGNDDMQMLLPYSYYSQLLTYRGAIMNLENDYLTLNGFVQFRLNPNMPELEYYFNEGLVGFLPGTASVSISRSHQTAKQRVSSGINSVSDTRYDTGVIGRVIDDGELADDPAYPTVIVIGSSPAQSAQGANFNHSFTHKLNSSLGGSDYLGSCTSNGTMADENIEHVKNIAQQVDIHGQLIENALLQGTSTSPLYGPDQFSDAMRAIAKMKSGNNPIPTKVFVVRLGGFDTHSNQMNGHSNLMRRLSQGIGGFIGDAKASQFIDNVRGFTISEFGRQIKVNDSMGTDHGDACTQLIFGACMGNQIPGQGVVIPDTIYSSQGVAPVNDIRDLWSMAIQWISNADDQTIEGYFEDDYGLYIPNFGSCSQAGLFEDSSHNYPILLSPNPCIDVVSVRTYYPQGQTRFEIHDRSGRLVALYPTSDMLMSGKDDVSLDVSNLSSGHYIVSVYFSNGRHMSARMTKIANKI